MSRRFRWVLMVVGCLAVAACGGATASTEAAQPSAAAAAAAAPSKSMQAARFGHTATLLSNGKVLVAGGFTGAEGKAFRDCELYDPATDTWTPAPRMLDARGWGRAVTLADGRVMLVGGLSGRWGWGKLSYAGNEIYDPATNTWTRAAASAKRAGHTATRLADGRVLVTGGSNTTRHPADYGSLSSAEIYDPATNSWSAAAPLPHPRGEHTAALQPDGRVLVAGFAVEHYAGEQTRSKEGGIDLYNPATNTWSNVTYMVDEASWGITAALPDGRVLIDYAVLDVASLKWTLTQGTSLDRQNNAPYVLYPDGSVAVAGGGWNLSWDYGFNDTAVHEFFDAGSKSWSVVRSLAVTRDEQTMTLLPDGRVLVAGGRDPAYTPLNSIEFLSRGAPPRTRAVRNDFDGNGLSDILWRNKRSGAIERWAMAGLYATNASKLRGPTTDRLVATGDLNGDGRADLVWDTGSAGSATGWLMKGSKRTATVPLRFSDNTRAWTVADTEGDDRVGVVWREGRSGPTLVLTVDPTNQRGESWTTFSQESVAGVGDFDGDRRDDLVFYDSRDGSTSVWRMFGPRRLGEPVRLWRDKKWRLAAVADFDGDGQVDLLRRSSDGTVEMWLMDGTQPIEKKTLLTDKNYTVAATGDFNGDGRADIVWYRADAGITVGWLMNGTARLDRATLRRDPDWAPIGP